MSIILLEVEHPINIASTIHETLKTFQAISDVFQFHVVSSLQVRLDRNPVLQVATEGVDIIVNQYHILDFSVGQFPEILDTHPIEIGAVLSVEPVTDVFPLRIQQLNHLVSVILFSRCENYHLEFLAHPSKELYAIGSDVDSDFLEVRV
jgi:hypothetical protein